MESLHAKLGRLTEQIADKGKWSLYTEASKKSISVESKIAAAESVLRSIGTNNESHRGPARKNNGAHENFVENNPFNEHVNNNGGVEFRETTAQALDRSLTIKEADVKLRAGVITEETHKILTGSGDVTIPAGLTSLQAKEYRHARAIGLNEAQALKLVRSPLVFRGTAF